MMLSTNTTAKQDTASHVEIRAPAFPVLGTPACGSKGKPGESPAGGLVLAQGSVLLMVPHPNRYADLKAVGS